MSCVLNLHEIFCRWINVIYCMNWRMAMEYNRGQFSGKRSVRPTFSAERIYGGTLLAMCSNDFICFYDWAECRLIRRIDVNVKVMSLYTFVISMHVSATIHCLPNTLLCCFRTSTGLTVAIWWPLPVIHLSIS